MHQKGALYIQYLSYDSFLSAAVSPLFTRWYLNIMSKTKDHLLVPDDPEELVEAGAGHEQVHRHQIVIHRDDLCGVPSPD